MINFYAVLLTFKRFFLKREELSDGRVVSITKKEYGSVVNFFLKIHKILKVNISLMIKGNLLKFSSVRNFHNKIVC